MIFNLGYSIQGKDKGTIYLIIKAKDNYYWVADGERFPLEKPKRKNRKHLQIIKKYSVNEILKISDDVDISNEMIIKLLNIIYNDIQEVK